MDKGHCREVRTVQPQEGAVRHRPVEGRAGEDGGGGRMVRCDKGGDRGGQGEGMPQITGHGGEEDKKIRLWH